MACTGESAGREGVDYGGVKTNPRQTHPPTPPVREGRRLTPDPSLSKRGDWGGEGGRGEGDGRGSDWKRNNGRSS